MAQLHFAYDRRNDSFVGATSVDTIIGRMPVFAEVRLKPIARRVAQILLERARRRAGVGRDEVGFFGFLKKAWKAVWNTAKKIAKAVGITKVINAVKNGVKKVVEVAGKIVKSPVFGAMMGVASFIPGIGPLATAGYAGVRAAMAVADGASRGDPKALATLGRYALPGGERAMALIRSVSPTRAG
ncbi:MAG: hypothetical protein IT384_18920 [Deltaproteobacteria bacterium]|nr:hypothetical protein [Deltaproteobacteria bacterium]